MVLFGIALFGFSFDLYFERPLVLDEPFFWLEKGIYSYGLSFGARWISISIYTPFQRTK